MKDLKNKAIDIKGKKYVLVSDRILYFNEEYPNGCIATEKISQNGADMIEFRAVVTPDVDNCVRCFTGHSQAVWGDGYINKSSAMENAETSAVGRALAMMGIGVIDSIASVDELNKAESNNASNMVNKEDAELVKKAMGIAGGPESNKFLRSIGDNLKKYGKLTEKQRESVNGIILDASLYNNS